MTDTTDAFKAIKQHRQEEGRERTEQAARDYPSARRRALDLGLMLWRCSDIHFTLRNKQGAGAWVINLYPSNQRIYTRSKKAPKLIVLRPWRLIDAVEAAAKAMREASNG